MPVGTVVGLVTVILAFCLPLFIGLRNLDLASDEAIYSYAVDRIVDTNEWLTPRSMPHDGPFLEKPPLKFWIVAAAIVTGMLPHDEMGLRFFDALFGALAFVYVFFWARWLSGPAAGVVAVFMLFTMQGLLFDHGLRENNMDAPLFLAYCAGMFHFARWFDADRPGVRRAHALAVAMYFVLGFMTKFVAALFLPLLCAVAVTLRRDGVGRVRAARSDWIVSAALVAAIVTPWFVYQAITAGGSLWDMVSVHVVQRFTSTLDPQHIQPWHYYVSEAWSELTVDRSQWWCLLGLMMLAVDGYLRAHWLSRLLVVWFILPIAAMSLGTSKVFHYAYPFLPPLAIGAGIAAMKILVMVEGAIARALRPITTVIGRLSQHRWLAAFGQARHFRDITRRSPVLRYALLTIAAATAFLAGWTAIGGPVRLHVNEIELLRNSSVLRPAAIAVLFLLPVITVERMLAVAIVAMLLPLGAYASTAERLNIVNRPLRALRDCLASHPGPAPDIRVYMPYDNLLSHSFFYYLRGVGPWADTISIETGELRERLTGGDTLVIMPRSDYRRFVANVAEFGERGSFGDPPYATSLVFPFSSEVVVLLPGPYQSCAVPARDEGRGVRVRVLDDDERTR